MTLFCGFQFECLTKNVAIIWEIFELPGLPAYRYRRILLVRKNIKEMLAVVGGTEWSLSGPDRGDLALPETGALITAEKTRD